MRRIPAKWRMAEPILSPFPPPTNARRIPSIVRAARGQSERAWDSRGLPRFASIHMRLGFLVIPFLTVIFSSSISADAERIAAGGEVAAVSIGDALAIRLDGELDDAAWQSATAVSDFLQREPKEGAPASFRTEARVLYDATGLYIAVRAFDPEPARIKSFLTRRDEHSSSDWIRVLIDSYHDRRTAYEFAVNPLGVKQDSYWFNDNNSDRSWDAVWEVMVTRDAEGWRAEFHIPFSQLRFSRQGDGRLGFAVVREVARLNETSTWPLLAKSASGYVSSFGQLTGLSGSRSQKRLELVPYAVSQLATVPREVGNPLQNATDPGASVGVDMKYAVTSALTFTGTVNPDFGQVEADPAVVNLSAFETFFSERRPFFVEGSGNFAFNMDCNDGSCTGLFYSRRIGRQPRGEPDLPDDGYSVQPLQSTIIGAGKLTGRVGKFSVGALTAATQEEKARLAIGSSRSSEVVEPFTFYSVARARREFADQSSLGFMVTSTNRRLVESVDFLPSSAATGGIDYDWRIGRRFSVNGFLAGSSLRGSTQAITELQESNVHSFQRDDAGHVDVDRDATRLNGYAGSVALGKIAGERTRFSSFFGFKSPGFDINDLGFQRRADERVESQWLQWRFDKPGKYVRTFRINFNHWGAWNFDGDRLFLGGNVNAHWTFQNFWAIGSGLNVNARGFDDRATRGGPGAYSNGPVGNWFYVETDARKPVSLDWFSFWNNDFQGSRIVELSPSVTVRPTSALSFQFGSRWSSNKDDAQWIENLEEDSASPHYVFGRLKQTTVAATFRVNYTMSPNLSLQLYGQPFVSAGRYEHYKELVDGRAERHSDRYRSFAYTDNADFNYLSFRTTNVLRWEFKPGSTLFVVWQQGRDEDGDRGDFRFGRDFRQVFSTPSSNTVLVKLAYWFNM
jgi:hypothetical protein